MTLPCVYTQAGKTPLHYAVMSDQIAVARALMLHGANTNACDENAQTPLHKIRSRFMGQILLKGGASPWARDKVRARAAQR